jgi:phytoene synthase
MKALFDTISRECSRNITKRYSTSFSLGIYLMSPVLRDPVYGIYGFVRLADEIVDSFEGFEQARLLKDFKADTYKAIEDKISLNPVLNSFQHVVHKFGIDLHLIEAFFKSMEMDLDKQVYNHRLYEDYIYGSAEVVGLMCLRVFCRGNQQQYEELTFYAQKLGSAFQKINFLRDIRADYQDLGRTYFPGIDFNEFSDGRKQEIEEDIHNDFAIALEGIKKLPKEARFGVFVAYIYYQSLFKKIKRIPSSRIMQERIRIPNFKKMMLLCSCYIRTSTNMI